MTSNTVINFFPFFTTSPDLLFTVIPPNSRFLGLRKKRNHEFGCLIRVPRVWRSQGLKSSERNREFGTASLRGITVYGIKKSSWQISYPSLLSITSSNFAKALCTGCFIFIRKKWYKVHWVLCIKPKLFKIKYVL